MKRNQTSCKTEIVTVLALIIGGILYFLTESQEIGFFLGTVIGGYFGNLDPLNSRQGNIYYD